MDHYAVIGNPVEHSLSPIIHAQFAEQTQQALDYVKLYAELDQFEQVVSDFVQRGGRGANITLPFKGRAFKLADQHSERAKLAQAANTLSMTPGGQIIADNTDGVGLVNDLTLNHQVDLTDKTIVMLGAGGAVCGVIAPLLEQQPNAIIIANRSKQKALDLAMRFAQLGAITGIGLNELPTTPAQIVINGTSASLQGKALALPNGFINQATLCYDMMYAKTLTPFLEYAKAAGATHTFDGLGMLVEQAAESFYIWRGTRPDTTPILQNLIEQFKE